MDLSVIDVIISCIILLTGLFGLYFGAIRFTIPFAVLFVAASIFYNYSQTSANINNEPFVNLFIYLLIGSVVILFYFVLAPVTGGIRRTAGFRFIDRFLGFALGLVIGVLIVGLIIWSTRIYNLKCQFLFQESKLADFAIFFLEYIMKIINSIFQEGKERIYHRGVKHFFDHNVPTKPY